MRVGSDRMILSSFNSISASEYMLSHLWFEKELYIYSTDDFETTTLDTLYIFGGLRPLNI